MGCCKCIGFFTAWSDPQPPVFKDEEGKEFCLFHAPVEEKRAEMDGPILTPREFEHAVTSRIKKAVRSDATECDFRETIFPHYVSLSFFKQTTKLPKMRFDGCKFHDKFLANDIIFQHGASFACAKFEGDVFIWRSSFRDDVDFSGAVFGKKLYLYRTTFSKCARLNSIKSQADSIEIEALTSESLGNCVFNSQLVRCIKFRGIRDWPQKLGFEKHITPPTSLKDLEELYRAMKQRAAEEHDQPLVSRWHFREKLMQLKGLLLPANCNALIEAIEDTALCKSTRARAWWELFRALPWRLRLSLPFLYWTSSGFGERATRGAACLLVLVLLPVFVLSLLKLIETGWSLTPDSQRIAEVLLEWVRCMPFAKLDTPTSNPPTILSALRTILSYGFQLVIGLQATLFALAVRNRFRR